MLNVSLIDSEMKNSKRQIMINYSLIAFLFGFSIALFGSIFDGKIHGNRNVLDLRGIDHYVIPLIFGMLSAFAGSIYAIRVYEKMEAFANLVLQENKFRLFYETLPIAYQSVDPEGNILEVNDAWLNLFEYQEKTEIIGKSFANFLIDSQKPQFLDGLQVLKDQGLVRGKEWTVITKSGKELNILLDGNSYYFEGKYHHSYCVFSDITSKKIAERTEREINEKAHQLKRMDTVYRMGSRLAHDLNNVLTILAGNASLSKLSVENLLKINISAIEEINQSRLDVQNFSNTMNSSNQILHKVLNYQNEINNGVHRASKQTNQLLKTTKKPILNLQAYNYETLISLIDEAINFGVDSNFDLEIVKNYSDEPINTKFDVDVFANAILNLIVNAVEAIEERDGRILIEVKLHDKPIGNKSYLRITVEDNGIGISQEYKENIFLPFYTTKPDGFGIGLSSSYSQIRKMGGLLDFTSEIGMGSSFSIYLPISSKITTHETTDGITGAQFLGTVLLVDDNEKIRNVIKMNLEQMGFTVYDVESGADALEILEKGETKFDGVLSDILMPHMNGTELYSIINKTHPDMKFVLMTGFYDEMSSNPVIQDVVTINKPILENDLIRIGQILDKRLL